MAFPETAFPEKTSLKSFFSKKTSPKFFFSEETFPEETSPEKTSPENTFPEETFPEETFPEKIITVPLRLFIFSNLVFLSFTVSFQKKSGTLKMFPLYPYTFKGYYPLQVFSGYEKSLPEGIPPLPGEASVKDTGYRNTYPLGV